VFDHSQRIHVVNVSLNVSLNVNLNVSLNVSLNMSLNVSLNDDHQILRYQLFELSSYQILLLYFHFDKDNKYG